MANPVPQIWLHLPLNGTLFPELKGELRFGNQKHFHPHHYKAYLKIYHFLRLEIPKTNLTI